MRQVLLSQREARTPKRRNLVLAARNQEKFPGQCKRECSPLLMELLLVLPTTRVLLEMIMLKGLINLQKRAKPNLRRVLIAPMFLLPRFRTTERYTPHTLKMFLTVAKMVPKAVMNPVMKAVMKMVMKTDGMTEMTKMTTLLRPHFRTTERHMLKMFLMMMMMVVGITGIF
ncbi:hypothetical protein BGW36DRAFT_374868 [Talaromyces proteolyticus]|uniref:Uncharacterized protein n=1 Tax=Talaromyces proteolyticus TaxID=1131652 RepID=A0AAD4Q2V4_9EURO|nr:uncharacterized protein BGW36DRAFT_374868 [Talaromyces proteolyticus]KAH8700733.1 hypothetical protein BGW36DRAFT_374868 [Talaromyces proteolyticus]